MARSPKKYPETCKCGVHLQTKAPATPEGPETRNLSRDPLLCQWEPVWVLPDGDRGVGLNAGVQQRLPNRGKKLSVHKNH